MVLRLCIYSRLVCFAMLVAVALRVEALEPEQVFEKASPSVVTVATFDATGRIVGFGSGVVIAPGEVITNCHVVEDGAKWRVKKGDRTSPAHLRFYDKQRDLCQLYAAQASSFTHPVRGLVSIDDLRVGQRVYAIGGPRGLELTLSEGLVSGLRQSENDTIQLIQTTAPISPGSSGGGLFDQDGRLVGITTLMLEESQNLNFALPASWVLELPSRQADLIEQRRREHAEQRAATAAAELRRKEEELAAAQAALLEERKRLGTEVRPQPSKKSALEEFDRIIAEKRAENEARGAPAVPSETKPQPKYEARAEPSLPAPLAAPTPPGPGRPSAVPAPSNPVAQTPLPTPPKLKRGDEDVALMRFTQDVWRTVGKMVSDRDYPHVARDQGWEGLTKVRIEIGSDGLLKRVTVTLSSGYSVLDDRAVSKIREIKLPNIPDELRERAFSVDVPFRFSLRKPEPTEGGAAGLPGRQ